MKKRILALLGLTSVALAASVISTSVSNKAHCDADPVLVDSFKPTYHNIKVNSFTTPTDNKYSTQKSYSMNIIGDIESVWDTYTGAGTKIAIIDDGFDVTHQEYIRSDGTSAILPQSRYYYSISYTNGNTDVYYYQYSSNSTCLNQNKNISTGKWDTHGTNTSTTAAAPMGNNGIVGIAPDADLLLIKTDMLLTSIEYAIKYAADQGCDVINMSLGAYSEEFVDGYGDTYKFDDSGDHQVYSDTADALEDACEYAHNKGSIIVAAAGNEATSVHSYPACNSYVIGVGALGQNTTGSLAKFTNHNKSESETGNKNVDILAPGYVYAAGQDQTATSVTHTYNNNQGTSFSSPIVAGAAALWKQKHKTGTPDEFEARLLETAQGIGNYKDTTISPTSGSSIDTNISCGRLDIGTLMGLGEDVTGVNMSQNVLSLYTAGSYTSNTSAVLTANVVPSSAENQQLTWSTSDSSVATISKTASLAGDDITITATSKAGTATITATSVDGGFTDTCVVTTSPYIPVTSFTLTDSNGLQASTITKGSTLQLTPIIEPSNASNKEVIYLADDESIVEINDETGVVKGLKEGSTIITGLCGNEELEDYYEVTVEKATSNGSFIISFYNSATLNETNSTNSWSLDDINNGSRVTLNNTGNNSIVTALDQTRGYKRIGGVSIGSKDKSGNVTLTIANDYKVVKVIVVGTYYDGGTSGGIKLNNVEGVGKLDSKGTAIESCKNSLVWEDLDYITTLAFTASTNRNCIYTITCEYASPTPETNYKVSFNNNGGEGTMADQTTNGSSYITPSCTFTAPTDMVFDKWALNSTTGSKYSVGSKITGITNNIILYATWKEDTGGGGGGDDPSYWTSWIASNTSAISTGGPTLVAALRTKISNVAPGNSNTLDYDDLWDAYATTDGIPGSNGTKIYDMYGGFEFRKGTDQAGSYKVEGDVYNREHSVPKSWFDSKTPAYSDIIHVVPTDGKVNGMRSNNTFGEVANESYSYSFPARSYNGVQYQTAGISKLGTPKAINGVTTTQSTVFEPDDQYKGDFARIYMYFAVRYCGTTCSPTSGAGSAIFTSSCTESNPYVTNYGLALLKKWHEQDPVSEKERIRNNGVEAKQGNRNPFVDYPEWADKIFGTSTSTPKVNSIALDPTSLSLDLYNKVSDTVSASVSADQGAQYTVSWTSSKTSVATVSGTNSGATITAVAEGTTTITAKAGDETATCTVTVTDNTPRVTGISLDSTKTLDLYGDATGTLTPIVTKVGNPSYTISWSSSNSGVVEVDQSGILTAKSTGSAVITASISSTISATCKVTVEDSTPGVQSIEIDEETVPVNLDVYGKKTGTITLKINADAGAVYEVHWTSSNENVATVAPITRRSIAKAASIVEASAEITAVGSGTTTITASAGGKEASYNLTIKDSTPHASGVTLDYISTTINIADTLQLNATVAPPEAINKNVTWSSSDSDVASVTANGLVTANSAGIATITVTTEEGGYTATCSVTVRSSSQAAIDDAKAWAIYFINKTTTTSTCKASTDAKRLSGLQDVWSDLETRYGNLSNDAKTAFCTNSDEKIKEALQHYQFIISKFNKDSTQLEDFVVDGKGKHPVSSSRSLLNTMFSFENTGFIVAILSIIGVTSIAGFVLYRKRKMY